MATITTNTFLDGGTARTAGEAWTMNSGAVFTIRTDTRVHANAPASFTGSLGSNTVTEGGVTWDSTAIRVVPYNTGSGNVPAIGTTISQGGVSGYFLGAYASWAVQATAVGSAMPANAGINLLTSIRYLFQTYHPTVCILEHLNVARLWGWDINLYWRGDYRNLLRD